MLERWCALGAEKTLSFFAYSRNIVWWLSSPRTPPHGCVRCDLVCERYGRLDAIVNNACQTIRRPPLFYQHLLQLGWKLFG
jgi:hypothetical protein